jgi:hypothetical protein
MILSDRIIEGSNEYKMAYVKSWVYELGRIFIYFSELLLKELPK